MKRILLVRPEETRMKYGFKGIIENEPLDLEIISAILSDQYEVTIFDLQVEDISFKDYIKNNYYDFLYIEGRCFQETFMFEYVHDFKSMYDNPVIIGGLHAQLNYQRFFNDEIDYILSGYNYYDLLKVLEGNYEDVYNLSYKVDNVWYTNTFKETDINLLARADRTYFYNHPDNYNYLDLKHALWLRTAFACPYKCEFCIRRKMNNSTYSRRDVYDVVDEIENNDNEVIYLVDDDFLVDINYVDTFINEINKRNIKKKYICYARSDFIADNEEMLKRFKQIGLVYVLVGLEDCKDDTLNSYNKLNSIKNNEKAIEICHKYSIRMMAMFILGLDYRYKDFKNLYRYIKKNNLKHVAVSIYTPELGVDNNYEYLSDDPSLFDYLHLVAKPEYLSVNRYYLYYYLLLIKLFIKGYRDGIYDFIDYKAYIMSFIRSILKLK